MLPWYTVACNIRGMERKEKGRRWDAGKVRRLRRHLGLTQQLMAGELGTRQQTISEWETGLYAPRGASATLLHIIAERAGFEYEVQPAEGEQPGDAAEEV